MSAFVFRRQISDQIAGFARFWWFVRLSVAIRAGSWLEVPYETCYRLLLVHAPITSVQEVERAHYKLLPQDS